MRRTMELVEGKDFYELVKDAEKVSQKVKSALSPTKHYRSGEVRKRMMFGASFDVDNIGVSLEFLFDKNQVTVFMHGSKPVEMDAYEETISYRKLDPNAVSKEIVPIVKKKLAEVGVER